MSSACSEPETTRDAGKGVALDLPEGVPRLGCLYLYLCDGCNLRCRHCWITPKYVDGEPHPGDSLDLDLLRLAVEEARPLGLSQAKLTGGEPMLHPRFVEVVDYLSAEGLRMTMETNGTLIDDSLAKHLKEKSKVWFVAVSLDAPTAEVHDEFRGKQGAFDEAVRGIESLVKAGYRPQIIMSPYRGNIELVDEVVELAVKLKAGSVKFNPVTTAGRGDAMHRRGEALEYDELMALVRYVRGELQTRTSIPLHVMLPPALSKVGELLRDRNAGGACRVWNVLGILGTGEMALCGIGTTVPELCFGKLGRTSLREAWSNHPVLVRLREELTGELPGICGDCVHGPRCLTHCVALNYVNQGKLITPEEMCSEALRRGEFPATRRRSYQGHA